jgi:hypothetical protein
MLFSKAFTHPRGLLLGSLVIFSILACSISVPDLPGAGTELDETELARDVDASLTALIAMETIQQVVTQPSTATREPATQVPPSAIASDTPAPSKASSATPEGLYIGSISFSQEVDENNLPVDPSESFEDGVTKLYATFPYSGLESGTRVKIYWELNGKEWYTYVIPWEHDPAGNYSFYIRYEDDSPLEVGNWAVKIYIGGDLVQAGRMKIE